MSPTDGETMIGPRREELKKILYSHGINNYDIPGGEPAAISSGHWCFRILTDVMNWADRWGGRPSREQIVEIIRGCGHGKCPVCKCNWCNGVADLILALYPAPPPERPKVTREEISEFLKRWRVSEQEHKCPTPGNCSCGTCDEYEGMRFIDDLCRLIGVEEEKPRWCEHLQYNKLNGDWHIQGSGFHLAIDWDICPVAGCHAPRPVEKWGGG